MGARRRRYGTGDRPDKKEQRRREAEIREHYYSLLTPEEKKIKSEAWKKK